MPTGFTAPVEAGEITTLRAYALRCSRAFGQLISMREDGLDAKLPDKIEPQRYHADRLEEARSALAKLSEMTPAEIAAANEASHQSDVNSHETRVRENAARLKRYHAMLDKIAAWEVPLALAELRGFMQDQINISMPQINYDPGPRPVKKTDEEWMNEALTKARRDIEYHSAEWAKERERAETATIWLNTLRVALA